MTNFSNQVISTETSALAAMVAQVALLDDRFRERAMLLFDMTESQVSTLEESLSAMVSSSHLTHHQGLN